jgi:RNA polymerase sigma-70 factor (ECF subfamily)
MERTLGQSSSSAPLTNVTASTDLVRQFQAGDEGALERLWSRYLPRLRRWAHGRLPPAARSHTNTDDLVQEAFVRSLAHLRTLDPRGGGALFAYFRTIVFNQIRDYARQVSRRPRQEELDAEAEVGREPSALEELIGAEVLERYEAAMALLPEEDQAMILAFVELRCSDAELAELFEKPSANAARMARGRALARLAEKMKNIPSVRSPAYRRSPE